MRERKHKCIDIVKFVSLIGLVLLIGVSGGCYSRGPSYKDSLDEVNVELQRSVTKLLIAVDTLDYLAKELSYVDAAFNSQVTALSLRNRIQEVAGNISDIRDRLDEIGKEMEEDTVQ